MKKQKKVKKLTLDKETLARLQQVAGGLVQQYQQVASGGPEICWISDCNPCN
jgi:hypothetical protein